MADRDTELEALTSAFWTVARRLRHGSQQTLAPFDLSPSHTRALGSLMHHGPQRLGALADHLGIAARSGTEVVDALEQRGLVRRSPDPDDRRATIVEATDEGGKLMNAIREARMQETDATFARLTTKDRRELIRILGLLAD